MLWVGINSDARDDTGTSLYRPKASFGVLASLSASERELEVERVILQASQLCEENPATHSAGKHTGLSCLVCSAWILPGEASSGSQDWGATFHMLGYSIYILWECSRHTPRDKTLPGSLDLGVLSGYYL